MRCNHLERREFISLVAGAAVAWPLAARAQEAERVRHIGVLMNFAADDPEGQVRLTAFLRGLQETGWTVGRNVRIDLRWGAANNELYRRYATELVALAPDVILASATPSLQALQQANRSLSRQAKLAQARADLFERVIRVFDLVLRGDLRWQQTRQQRRHHPRVVAADPHEVRAYSAPFSSSAP
jgi:hypothetical protein